MLLLFGQIVLVSAALAQSRIAQPGSNQPVGNGDDKKKLAPSADNLEDTVPNPYQDALGVIPQFIQDSNTNTRGIDLNVNKILKRDNPYGMAEQSPLQPRVFQPLGNPNSPGQMNQDMNALDQQNSQLSTLAQQAAEQGDNAPQSGVNSLLGSSLGSINETYRGMHQFFNDDIIGNLFSSIGQLIGKWISELINGWIADTVQFLAAFLRVFVLNPNIAVNGLNGSQQDGISRYIRDAADVMYGIAVDLLLLLFILAIWKYWAEAAWRGGSNLMGAVGRLIFTSGLLLAFPTLYAFEIQITNEMIKAIYFNSADQVGMLEYALASAIKGGILAGVGGLASAFAPLLGGIGMGAIGGTVGEVFAFAGLMIFMILGGVLIAELIYILILKAIQTALLTAQYMFAPIFLVFFASPDTENVATGFIKSWVETSLWTFVWVGLLKVMVIIMFSNYNPWGKILMAIGVLQMMIQVPTFLSRAQISPMSDFISAGLIFNGGLVKMFGALQGGANNLGYRLMNSTYANAMNRDQQAAGAQVNVGMQSGDPLQTARLARAGEIARGAGNGATPPINGLNPDGMPRKGFGPDGKPLKGHDAYGRPIVGPHGATPNRVTQGLNRPGTPPARTGLGAGSGAGLGAAGGAGSAARTVGSAASTVGLGAAAGAVAGSLTNRNTDPNAPATATVPITSGMQHVGEEQMGMSDYNSPGLATSNSMRGIVKKVMDMKTALREGMPFNQVIGSMRSGASMVGFRQGATDAEKAHTLLTAGFADHIGEDPQASDAAKRAAVKAGADRPKGLMEGALANYMSFQGQSFRSSAIGRGRLQRSVYSEAVKGSQDYINGRRGNEYSEYLRGRYGAWTPEKDAEAVWLATDTESSESAWNPALSAAVSSALASGLPLNAAVKGALQNASIAALRPAGRAPAVQSLLRACMADPVMRGVDPTSAEGQVMLGELSRAKEQKFVNTAQGLRGMEPTDEQGYAHMNQVADFVGMTGTRSSHDMRMAYRLAQSGAPLSSNMVSTAQAIVPAGTGPIAPDMMHHLSSVSGFIDAGKARPEHAQVVSKMLTESNGSMPINPQTIEVATNVTRDYGNYNGDVTRAQLNLIGKVANNASESSQIFNHFVHSEAESRNIDKNLPLDQILSKIHLDSGGTSSPATMGDAIIRMNSSGGFDRGQLASPVVFEAAYNAVYDPSPSANSNRVQSIQIAHRIHGESAIGNEQIMHVYDSVIDSGVNANQMNMRTYYAAASLLESNRQYEGNAAPNIDAIRVISNSPDFSTRNHSPNHTPAIPRDLYDEVLRMQSRRLQS